MPDAKISELPAATAPTGVELVEIVQGGVNKQTTTQEIADLGGGGVSSVFTRSGAVVAASGDYTATQITNTPAGGIAATTVQAAIDELDTEKQPLDSDLTAIAALTPSNDDIIQRKAGVWTNRTMAQLATDLTGLATAFVETDTAYVDAAGSDSTGVLGRADKPFLTITAALTAGVAVTSLRIKIGLGLFGSPAQSDLRSNLWLEGSGKPGYNNTYTSTTASAITITDPSALVGGTRLGGQLFFQDTSNVHITDLGVDCGNSFVVAGGTEANQLIFLSATTTFPFTLMKNIVIRNVTTLGRTASSAFHGIQIENGFKPLIINCDTYFSTHGIVLKCYGGIVTNVRCHFHTANAVIFKTDTYAIGWLSQLHNFEVQGGGGVNLDIGTGPSTGAVAGCKISNGVLRSTTFGVRTNSTVGGSQFVSYVDINNVTVYVSTGIGFDIDDSQSVRVMNCQAIACTTGFRIIAASTYTFCFLLNCHSEANTLGYDISAPVSSAIVRNCSARSNTTGWTFAGIVYVSGLTNDSNSTNYSGSVLPINIERGKFFFGSSGVVAPSALVQLAAGAAGAALAPLKFTAGTNLTTPEAGAVEFDGTNYFVTISTTRHTLAKTLTATATLNFDLTAVNYQDLTITVTGAVDGEAVVIGVPNGAAVADVTYFGWVSAANTVTIRASRVGGGGAADPASGTFRASVVKY